MLSDNELLSHVTIAREVIETHTSATVWRTAIRIHELIRVHFPFWKYNEALVDEVKFSSLLSSFCYEDEMTPMRARDIDGEHFEEWHHEPILFWDAQFPSKRFLNADWVKDVVPPFQRINVRGIIVQRELYRLLGEWLDFRAASEIVHKLHPQTREDYVLMFRNYGFTRWNIYYKRKDSSWNARNTHEFPKVPEMIS